ncbi:expressed unknown protein (Partial), partial [Seminavis robusta]
IIREHVLNLLPASTAQGILRDIDVTDLMNSTVFTPQQKAYKWVRQDPNLSNYTNERIVQRFALATFYYSTGGSQWDAKDNWLTYNDVHECDWFSKNTYGFIPLAFTVPRPLFVNESVTGPIDGVPCKDQQYEHLWLNHNGMYGQIPEEMYLLTNLKSISLDRNDLTGTISANIGQLTRLEELDLYSTSVDGTIPSEIGLLPLKVLFLIVNLLSGQIPSEVGLLTELRQVLLDTNLMTGPIPPEMAFLSKLEKFSIWQNAITGSVPNVAFQWPGLFSVEQNLLSSTIPTELGLSKLTGFAVWNNGITGSIPSEVALMTDLVHLGVANNLLNGTIPTELGSLSLRDTLQVHNNQLT